MVLQFQRQPSNHQRRGIGFPEAGRGREGQGETALAGQRCDLVQWDPVNMNAADFAPIVRRPCPTCGDETFRLHLTTRRGLCTNDDCAAFFVPVSEFELLEVGGLLAEHDRGTAWAPDFGLSAQVCPRCTTATREGLGEYSRKENCFRCEACGVRLYGLAYERELEQFQAARYRAKQASAELDEVLRAMR